MFWLTNSDTLVILLSCGTGLQLDLQTLVDPGWLAEPERGAQGYVIARDSIGCRNRREALRRLAKKCLTTVHRPSFIYKLDPIPKHTNAPLPSFPARPAQGLSSGLQSQFPRCVVSRLQFICAIGNSPIRVPSIPPVHTGA